MNKRHKNVLKQAALWGLLTLCANELPAQQVTSFQRMGSQDEKVQDLFPGSHRARPVLADFTNNGHLDLFYAGQDLGTTGEWYLKEPIDTRWGDLGDGTFANPVLNADYSDPDVIRVGEKYYMTCSEFHFMGMVILESDDMVNWTVINRIYDRLDFPKYYTNEKYGGGSWAPTIRYHDNKFWVYFCTPEEGLFMTNATDPAGTWAPLVHVKDVSGWEDPCPLWDGENAYLGRSQLGGGPIIIHRMSLDGTQLLDNGQTVYEGPTAEGTKLFIKDGYYYISIPEGGVSTGWQTVMRSRDIYGPYEQKIVLEQGSTKINGPHQGALVDTPEGEWWFYHFQGTRALGRVMHLQPVTWVDGFPVIGEDYDGNGIGEPMMICRKPNTGKVSPISGPQTDDDFNSPTLAPYWQFNHNPDNSKWSLTTRPGYLSIEALRAPKLRDARNSFTQKIMGYSGEASTELDCNQLQNGQRAGLHCIGGVHNAIGIERSGGKNYLYVEIDGTAERLQEITATTVYLKVTLDAHRNSNQFHYSLDGINYTACKDPFKQHEASWKGPRVGIFSYNTSQDGGRADFNWFKYEYDGPGKYTNNALAGEPVYEDWHGWNELAALVKNNGDGTFSLMQEYDIEIQPSSFANSLFFDYNNDGNLDLLLLGKGGGWRYNGGERYVHLYKNLGQEHNYHLQKVQDTGLRQECDEYERYFNMVSVGDYDRDGYTDVLIMSDHNGRHIRLYKNDAGTGRFIEQENIFGTASMATNGAVMFGDVDNDGWLDILYTGYGSKAREIRIHKNMQDGTFQDITPGNILGGFESQSVFADVNGDGTLDIVVTGHGDNWARYASIYYNTINPATKLPEFTLHDSGASGLRPINKANLLVADFNNDGLQDIIMNGYDGSKDLTLVYYQKANNQFVLDTNRPLFPIKDGGINMGDVDGDGNLDVVIAGYKGSDSGDAYDTPVRIYKNQPEQAGIANNQAPSAPSFVNAEHKNGKLKITWGDASDDITATQALRYNIYVKNNATQEVYTMVPADITTGRIKVGTDIQTALSSSVKEYTLSVAPGSYTVGVQAIDQACAGGMFRVHAEGTSSCNSLKDEEPFKLEFTNQGIIIRSPSSEHVGVFNLLGKKVTETLTNTPITLSAHSVYIMKVKEQSFKVAM